jgi:hypothetical protein
MDGDDGVLAIVLAAEHLLRLAGVHFRGEIVERAPQIVGHRFARLGPLGEHGEILEPLAERHAEIAIFLEAPPPLQQLLRRRLILPEIRRADALFDGLQFAGGMCRVKDSSAGRRRGAPDPDTCEAVRPTGMPNLELLNLRIASRRLSQAPLASRSADGNY